jgi:hypothetical protein
VKVTRVAYSRDLNAGKYGLFDGAEVGAADPLSLAVPAAPGGLVRDRPHRRPPRVAGLEDTAGVQSETSDPDQH